MKAIEFVSDIHCDTLEKVCSMNKKCLFEITLCENGSQTSYKFRYVDYNENNEILLINSKHKVIHTLSTKNVNWINKVFLYDKNMRITISNFKFADFNNLPRLKGDDTNG